MRNGISPSVSPAVIIYLACQLVGPPEITLPFPAMTTDGVIMVSFDVKETVISLPTLAFVGSGLFE